MSSAVLLLVLSHLYPRQWGYFAFLIVWDIVSQMYGRLALSKTTHKGSRNAVLNFHYTFPYTLLVSVGETRASSMSLLFVSRNRRLCSLSLMRWLLSAKANVTLITSVGEGAEERDEGEVEVAREERGKNEPMVKVHG
jgi:hypothetical protein